MVGPLLPALPATSLHLASSPARSQGFERFPGPTAEDMERQYKDTLSPTEAMRLTRNELWKLLLAKENKLAACFEELGWAQEDAPKHIVQLYKLLSRHVHNEFQLSRRQVDIVVSVTGQGAGQASRPPEAQR